MATDAPLLEQMAQSPLLIEQGSEGLFRASIQHVVSHEHAQEFLSSAISMSEDEDFWPRGDDWRATYRPYNVKNGILQIPVMGVLLNRFPWQLGRWATGYTYIEKALSRGLADGNVRGIAFIHDSPGGEVAGNFELNDKIFSARGVKPMRAFAMDHSYSASYSLSSAAGPLSVSRSGGVGSIGVVTAHVEYADAMAKMGIKVTFIFAGKHKVDGNPYEKLPDSVKSRIQDRIDRIYGVFTAAIARNRAMDENKVRATEALTFDAKDAIENGLADRIGSLEEEMVLFSEELAIGDENMADNTTKEGIPQAKVDELVTAARAEGKAEGVAEGTAAGTAAGATAERTRINAILGSDEGKKRPKAAMSLAMKTGLSLEDATASLADMPEERAAAPEGTDKPKGKSNAFEEAMNAAGGANVGGGNGDDEDGNEGGGDKTAKASNSILSDYAVTTGFKRKTAA